MARRATLSEAISQAVFDAIARKDSAALVDLVHPKGEWELVTARGRLVRGRAAIVRAFERAWRRIHDVQAARIHPLSDEAAIVEGRSRYSLTGGGFADAPVVWLNEIRDERLWRVRIFDTVEAAKKAWTAAPDSRPRRA